MQFIETGLKGSWLLEPECHGDERGFFARTFCAREFAEHGLPDRFAQCNISFNHKRGTLRGMHFQHPPHEEGKLVRCTMGAIHDIIVDLRPDSPTRLQHFAVELSAENRRQLFVPKGFAHGFQTLADGSEVFYQMSEFFVPGVAAGLRYDDPALGLHWPLPVSVIATKDLELPVLK